jgi:hypothetical protein
MICSVAMANMLHDYSVTMANMLRDYSVTVASMLHDLQRSNDQYAALLQCNNDAA